MVKKKHLLNWEGSASDHARVIIQVEMAKRDLTFGGLTKLLNDRFDAKQDARNVSNRVGRSTFSAGFFLMCLLAMDVKQIEITDKW